MNLVRCAFVAMAVAMPFGVSAQEEVDSAEVWRRGDHTEYVDGWTGRASMHGQIIARHDDAEKFFISIFYRRGDDLRRLKQEWAQSKPLASFANPLDAASSWAHLRFYDLDDASQNWRWEGIRIDRTPSVVLQPCTSGSWGEPSTVILQRTYEHDPRELAARMAYALRLYASKLAERPLPQRQPRPRYPVNRRPVDWQPVRAQYSADSDFGDEPAPWAQPRANPIEIPPLPFAQDEQGQCPGPDCPRPRPRPQPRPQPDEYDDEQDSPWKPNIRPRPPFPNPFDEDGGDFPAPKKWSTERWLMVLGGVGLTVYIALYFARSQLDRLIEQATARRDAEAARRTRATQPPTPLTGPQPPLNPPF
jgi:hypothetical protein